MTNEIACLTLPYRHEPLERALEGIVAAGYRVVGTGLAHADGPIPRELTAAEADRLAAQCDRHGLKLRILYGGRPQRTDVESLCRLVDFAKDAGVDELLWTGVSGYRNFPNEPLSDADFRAAHDEFVEKMRKVGARAEQLGVTITLKPHTGNTATAPVLAATLDAIGSPAVKASYDPGNVRYYEGVDPAADMAVIAGRTYSLVMKDHRGPRAHNDFPVPGEGEVDFGRILRDLIAGGFDGRLVVERVDGADGQVPVAESDARIRRALRNIEAMLGSARA